MKRIAEIVGEWETLARAVGYEVERPVLRPGATEAEIGALEDRLGVALPASYRAFLRASNGADVLPGAEFYEAGSDEPSGMRSVGTVDWVRRCEPDLVAIWTGEAVAPPGARRNPEFESGLDERRYLDHDDQDCVNIKAGHLRYALSVSQMSDGYAVFLNPLVVDADGEWEAWDFGTKHPGAFRFPSFAQLMSAANEQAWRHLRLGPPAATLPTADALIADALDKDRRASDELGPLMRRSKAISGLTPNATLPAVRKALRTIVDDDTDEDWIRQAAASVLVSTTPAEERVREFLPLAGSPVPRLRAVILPGLATSEDPVAREAALSILTDPTTESWVLHSLPSAAADLVWEAWQRSGLPPLLEAAAFLFDERCVEPMVAILENEPPDTPGYVAVVRALWRFRDPRAVAALVAAGRRAVAPGTLLAIGQTLHTLGAVDEAVDVLERVDGGFLRMAAQDIIARSRTPMARARILEAVRTQPTSEVVRGLAAAPNPAVVRGLAASPEPASVAALEPLLATDLRLDALVTLEAIATPDALDVLARESAAGDMLATRALARLRDMRALAPLLDALESADEAAALDGADGLRDLRSQEAVEPLLRASGHANPDVAVVATHALICMRSPHMVEGLRRLAAHDDAQARKLAGRWLAALERERERADP